jgi:uncharacterized membrane protein
MSACAYSAILSAGPWLFTTASLAIITVLMAQGPALRAFQVLLVHNFALSLLLTAPLALAVTRHLADLLYEKRFTQLPAHFSGALLTTPLVVSPPALLLHFIAANESTPLATASVVNVTLLSLLWVSVVFLSTLRSYRWIALSFLVGGGIAALTVAVTPTGASESSALQGVNFGLAITLGIIAGRVFGEFPYCREPSFDLLTSLRAHWEICLGAFLFQLGAWGDKLLMWFSREGMHSANGLRFYPPYDDAMFLAQILTIPALALFVLYVETDFYRSYVRFYHAVLRHGSLETISGCHRALIRTMVRSFGNLTAVQAVLSVGALLLAPGLVKVFGFQYEAVGILRYGILGSLFTVLTVIIGVFLAYLNAKRDFLVVQAFYAVATTLGTAITLHLGFPYYGYGFFGASVATFVLAAVLLAEHIRHLPYHAFVTNNSSIGKG